MEEGTGEKCGYCPGGVAVIDRFSELWPERFIPVAIHCFENFSTGVMENSEYADPFVTIPGLAITSLPSAILNRAELTNPTDFIGIMTSVENIMASRSAMKVAIDRVDCDFATGHVDVKFTASACAPFPYVGVNAAAILTADGLTGTTRQWYQSNYYSKTSKESFVGDDPLMEEWWPYMKFWCEYPSKDVSPTDYQYDHVGMGIYPGFNGDDTLLDSDWSAAQSQSGTISFDMPMQQQANAFGVQDSHKTAVTVVLIRESDGSILAADRVEADRFNQELSGIEDVAAPDDDIRAAFSGGVLTIRTPRDMTVDIFSSTGIRIARINATEGVNSVPLDYNGVVIIKGDTFAKRFMTTK